MTVFGLDLAKVIFVVGRDGTGAVGLRTRLAWSEWQQLLVTLPQTIPGIAPVTATALIGAIDDVTPCTSGDGS
jgi:hypothetical protein